MGRPVKYKEMVKKYFTLQASTRGKSDFYKCKFCSKSFAKNFSRMIRHLLLDCKNRKLSDEDLNQIKKVCQTKTETETLKSLTLANSETEDENDETDNNEDSISNNLTNSDSVAANSSSNISVLSSDLSFSRKKMYFKDCSHFLDRMTEEEQNYIWDLLARATYASDTPLSFTENQYWIEALKKIRPSLKLPSRYQLAHSLLDKEYDRVQEIVTEKLVASQFLSIQLDAWSNIRFESVINVIITTPEPVIYKTINCQAERHTGEYIAQVIQRVFEDVGSEKFIAVITDNARNMIKAQELISNSYPERPISFYGCVAHVLNLFVKDILQIKLFMEIEDKAKLVVKKIKYVHVNNTKFAQLQKENGGQSLKIPVKTRWASSTYCFKSLQENKRSIQMLAVSAEADLSGELIEIILDNNGFWEILRILLDVLSCVLKWITLLEADECRIPFVIEAFMEIKEIIDSKFEHPQCSNYKKNILDSLESRKEYTIKDIHKAAHLLNPRSKGNLLTAEESVDAMRFISELATAILPADECQNVASELALYRTSTGLFHKKFVWNSLKSQSNGKKLCPIIWWKGICGSTSLSKVAVAILQCPPTTAATERSFSTSGSVHTLKRNRLTGERAAKLTYIKHNLKKISAHNHESSFMDPNDYAASTEPMEYDDEEMDEEDEEVIILEVTDSFTDA